MLSSKKIYMGTRPVLFITIVINFINEKTEVQDGVESASLDCTHVLKHGKGDGKELFFSLGSTCWHTRLNEGAHRDWKHQFSKARVWRLEVQPFLNVNFSFSSLKLRVWVEVKTFSAFLASVTVTFCLVPMPNLSLSISLLSCTNFKVSVFLFFFFLIQNSVFKVSIFQSSSQPSDSSKSIN